MIHFLVESGPMALVAGLLGLLGLPIAVFAGLAIGVMRWRLPASIGWVPATLAVCTGMLGVILSTNSALSALTHAAPEMKQTMLARGIAQAMGSMTISTGTAGIALLAFALTAWLPAAIFTGPDSRFNGTSLVASGSGAVVGGLAASVALVASLGAMGLREAGVAPLLLIPLAGALTLCLVLCSARESLERQEQGRIAGSRVAITVASVIGLLLLGEFFRYQGMRLAFEAVAVAPPEMKSEMLAQGIEIAGSAFTLALCLALMPLAAGFGGALPVLGRVDSRELAGAGVAGVQLMLMVAAVAVGTGRLHSLFGLLHTSL